MNLKWIYKEKYKGNLIFKKIYSNYIKKNFFNK